jgi:cytochrome P450
MAVGSFQVPAGTVVGTPLFAIQNCAANWEKPDDFIPERWLDVPVETYVYDSTTKTSGGKRGITFMPFSEGPRNCVGQVSCLIAALGRVSWGAACSQADAQQCSGWLCLQSHCSSCSAGK